MENPNHEEAVKEEVDQDVWRTLYKSISTWTLNQINTIHAGPEPRRRVENMVLEPPNLSNFLEVLVMIFEAAAAT